MDANPYAPPTATVADLVDLQAQRAVPPFFAVSPIKLFVMCVCTFQIYQLFWFSRQWKAIAKREGRKLNPYVRSIFAVIYGYPCFARVRDYQAGPVTASGLPAGLLAIGFIVATGLSRLPDPYWLIALFVQPLPLVVVQRYANRLNMAAVPSHNPNDRFTGWNWVALGLGSLFLTALVLLVLLGIDE